jgi:hypothetical protein
LNYAEKKANQTVEERDSKGYPPPFSGLGTGCPLNYKINKMAQAELPT